jgi:hypothetical protein
MERKVNGHFDDPNSTRDITGITPEEFNVLINLLIQKYESTEIMFSMDIDKRKELVLKSAIAFDLDAISTGYDKFIDGVLNKMAEEYNIIYKFLQEINQPYPGADYTYLEGLN